MNDAVERVQASFAEQGFMHRLGAELVAVSAGEVTIALPFRADLTQQHGFLDAAVTTAVVDSASSGWTTSASW